MAGVKSLSNYQKKSLSNRGFFCRFAFVCVLSFRLYLKTLLRQASTDDRNFEFTFN